MSKRSLKVVEVVVVAVLAIPCVALGAEDSESSSGENTASAGSESSSSREGTEEAEAGDAEKETGNVESTDDAKGAEAESSDETPEGTSEEATSGASATDTGSEEKYELGPAGYGPGTFDASAGIGLTGLLYASVEPGIDVGLIPVSEDVTLSLGASLGLGYCLLCGLTSVVTNFSVKAWQVSPQGRFAFHINSVGRSLGAPVDMYGGVSAGPNFYFYSVTNSGNTLRGETTTLLVAPLVGGRFFPGGSGAFFLFAEGRWQFEIGFNEVRLEDDEWNAQYSGRQGFTRSGLDVVLGGGVRF